MEVWKEWRLCFIAFTKKALACGKEDFLIHENRGGNKSETPRKMEFRGVSEKKMAEKFSKKTNYPVSRE